MVSPLAGVSNEAWTEFVRALGAPECASAVSDGGNLGLFLFSPARLETLGAMRNIKRERVSGRQVVTGEFVPPMTQAQFLEDTNLQYRAFARSCQDYAPRVARYVDAPRLTLSGLLAVAHYAGVKGLRAWVGSREDRMFHPFTTASFERCNGFF